MGGPPEISAGNIEPSDTEEALLTLLEGNFKRALLFKALLEAMSWRTESGNRLDLS
jgi:hypothetical protein